MTKGLLLLLSEYLLFFPRSPLDDSLFTLVVFFIVDLSAGRPRLDDDWSDFSALLAAVSSSHARSSILFNRLCWDAMLVSDV